MVKYWDDVLMKLTELSAQEKEIEPGHVFLWMLFTSMIRQLHADSIDYVQTIRFQAAIVHRSFQILDRLVTEPLLQQLDEVPIPNPETLEKRYQKIMYTSQREKTGSFFTENDLAALMVKETLRTHYWKSMSRKAEPWFPLDISNETTPQSVVNEQIQWVEKISLIDISCGGGIFLRQGMIQLLSIYRRLYQRAGRKFIPTHELMITICNKLTGVERQPETLVLADLLLRLQMIQMNPAINPRQIHQIMTTPIHMECADALLWQPPFPGERYSLILGNPPYVGEKGNQDLFTEIRCTEFGKQYYQKNMDLSYYFIHRGLQLLKSGGCLCYIMTSYFTTADGASKLRTTLMKESYVNWLIYPENISLFPEATGQHNLIFCLSGINDQLHPSVQRLHISETVHRTVFFNKWRNGGLGGYGSGSVLTVSGAQSFLYDKRGQMLLRAMGSHEKALTRFEKKAEFQLNELCSINQGLVTGADKVKGRHRNMARDLTPGCGIFVLSTKEKDALLTTDPQISKWIEPFYKNSHILPYRTKLLTDNWLLYLTDDNLPDIEMIPVLKNHLAPYRRILENRREVQKNLRCWHSIHWPRQRKIFENPKIVAPQRSLINVFAMTAEPWYASADVYYIQIRPDNFFSFEYLTGWLNSAICYAWLSYYGKRKGRDLELYATPLKNIPVITPPDRMEELWLTNQVLHLMDPALSQEASFRIQESIDNRLFQWIGLTGKETEGLMDQITLLRRKFQQRNSLNQIGGCLIRK